MTHSHSRRWSLGTRSSAPRVLVAFASRHGATRELAATVARELARAGSSRGSGLAAVLAPVQTQPDAVDFDAVVLGSPVYDGRWLESAIRWAEAMSTELRERPVWLFSGGLPSLPVAGRPVGDGRWLADAIGAREHRYLGGRVEQRLLSVAERAAWPASRTEAGDRRDWPAVRDWCSRIAHEVATRPVPAAVG